MHFVALRRRARRARYASSRPRARTPGSAGKPIPIGSTATTHGPCRWRRRFLLALDAQQLADDPWLHPTDVIHDLPAQIVVLGLVWLPGHALATRRGNSVCFQRDVMTTLPVGHALGHDFRNRRYRAGMACQVASLLGTYIRRQHEDIPLIEPDEVHLGIQERTMFAVPDCVVDDQKRHGMAIAMARRHFTVEGLGPLVQPLFGCSEKRDIIFRCWQ